MRNEEKAEAKKVGRPREFKEEYIDMTREYTKRAFIVRPDTDKITPFDEVCILPTIEGLSRYLGVALSTVHEWRKEYPVFSDAVEELKERQAEMVLNKGALGLIAPKVAGVLLSNHGYTETQKIEQRDVDANGNDKEKTVIVIGRDAGN